MMTKKLDRKAKAALLAAASASMLAFGSAPAAQASTGTDTCSDDGHVGKVVWHWKYNAAKTRHIWQYAEFRLDGSGTGGKSNVYFKLRVNGDLVFNQEAPPKDDIDNDHWYKFNFRDFSTPRGANENFTAKFVFDEFGTDDKCTALLNY